MYWQADQLKSEFLSKIRQKRATIADKIKSINVSLKLLKGEEHKIARFALNDDKRKLNLEDSELSNLEYKLERYDD